jgi:hypothetical protein
MLTMKGNANSVVQVPTVRAVHTAQTAIIGMVTAGTSASGADHHHPAAVALTAPPEITKSNLKLQGSRHVPAPL